MRLVIIGPQASGKGTQADLIAKRLGIPHVSSGELLREEKRSGSALGREIAALIDNGSLVPDDLIWRMLERKLTGHPEGWILDGYPRTESQAALLAEAYDPDQVILLEVPEQVSVERISGRRICETCGHDYHVKYKPPKRPGTCDADGGRLVQRADDQPEAIKRRLQAYHEKTEPLLRRYQKRLLRINGDQGIEEVWHEIRKKLKI